MGEEVSCFFGCMRGVVVSRFFNCKRWQVVGSRFFNCLRGLWVVGNRFLHCVRGLVVGIRFLHCLRGLVEGNRFLHCLREMMVGIFINTIRWQPDLHCGSLHSCFSGLGSAETSALPSRSCCCSPEHLGLATGLLLLGLRTVGRMTDDF